VPKSSLTDEADGEGCSGRVWRRGPLDKFSEVVEVRSLNVGGG
jgi:hypothetical protein